MIYLLSSSKNPFEQPEERYFLSIKCSEAFSYYWTGEMGLKYLLMFGFCS